MLFEIFLDFKLSINPLQLLSLEGIVFIFGRLYRVAPPKNGTVDRFLGLCSDQQLSFSPRWIEHHFLLIITPRSTNLVETFLFYE